jgi:hypothetical protein
MIVYGRLLAKKYLDSLGKWLADSRLFSHDQYAAMQVKSNSFDMG